MKFVIRLFVFSDTHLPARAKALPQVVIEELERADYVIHAGDYTTPQVLNVLEQSFLFSGVAGNNDGPEIEGRLGNKKLIQVGGFKIGIVHGDMGTGKTTLDRAMDCFKGEELDLLVFGHSHIPYLKRHGNAWVMNPGSPTDRRRNLQYSYGIVEIGTELNPELIYFGKTSSMS